LVEASVRVIKVIRSPPDRVQVRDRTVAPVIRRDLVVVQVEAVLRPRVRQVVEAEAEAVARHRQALRVTEAEMDILSRRVRRLEAVQAVVVVDRAVVPLVARRFLQDHRVRLTTLQTFRMEVVSENQRINVVR
jgi:hypothetical protein